MGKRCIKFSIRLNQIISNCRLERVAILTQNMASPVYVVRLNTMVDMCKLNVCNTYVIFRCRMTASMLVSN
jgi:hypothetical protein